MSYKLDTTAAKKVGSGSRIVETGEHIGSIVHVEDITAGTGTKGVSIAFKSDAGETADLTLYTIKTDGTKIMGYDMLMALMTVCKIKQTTTKPGMVKKWNAEAGAQVDTAATLIPEFADKRVGVLLEKEEYRKNDGGVGFSMKLIMPFCPDTRRIASEILGGDEAGGRLERIKATIKDRPLAAAAQSFGPPTASVNGPAPAAPLEEDDLPWT